jgi:hypothetical protein
MISPLTVGLVVGSVALVGIVSGWWWLAALAGVAAWVARVALAVTVARRVRELAPRIDPFALREPWRFFVANAVSARKRFNEAVSTADDGPLRERLLEVESQLQQAVSVTWTLAQRGQQLTDARRRIDLAAIERTLENVADGDPRRAAAVAQRDSHTRLLEREGEARDQLEILDARYGETIVRAAELATRAGGQLELDALVDEVNDMVDGLDSLRLALDEVDDDT